MKPRGLKTMELNIGINAEDRQQIATGLSKLLADSYSLYLKTHNYHWNVEGPLFNTLHLMFEEHYTELATAVDEIAERIRALGIKAPGSYTAFRELTSIDEATGDESAETMIRQLVIGQETVARTAREAIKAAEAEKNAWMLRSMLA
jgi:starvation-inducible DNA-binding protein